VVVDLAVFVRYLVLTVYSGFLYMIAMGMGDGEIEV